MQNTTLSRTSRLAVSLLGLAAAGLFATGCGVHMADVQATPIATAGSALHGSIHGGQQPVVGSAIQLYAASTGGYGVASYSLLNSAVFSNGSGNFSITGTYTCPSASSLVYVVATGGNPGAGVNRNLAMMAALGACGDLTPSSFISINEVTTVASVYALAPFMTSTTQVSTSATNLTGLTNAFANVNKLANIATGSSTGTLPANAAAPVSEINTLADILASCINTVGSTSGSAASPCAQLFNYTTAAGGTAPTDTIGAALNIAKNPGSNVTSLLSLVTPTSPFQPTLATANDFTVGIKYKPSLSTPSALAIASNGDAWVTNAGNSTISVVSAGTGAATVYSGGGLSAPSGIAFDPGGNAWVTDKSSSKLSVFTAGGAGSQAPVVGLSSPSDVAIDGQGSVWVANTGNNTLTKVSVSGTAVISSTNTSAGGINAPAALAINPY